MLINPGLVRLSLCALLAVAFGCLSGCNKPADSDDQSAVSMPSGHEMAAAGNAAGTAPAGNADGLTLASYQVEGMTCEDCSAAITQELTKLDGVASVAADYKTGTVKVGYQPAKVSDEKVIASIESLKFKVAQHGAVAGVEPAAAGSTDPASFILASTKLENGHVQDTFGVSGMTCAGCEGSVSAALAKVAGVDSCVASSKDGTAIVTYDPAKATPAILLASIKETGFTPVAKPGAGCSGACCQNDPANAAAKTADGGKCCGQCKGQGGESSEKKDCCGGCKGHEHGSDAAKDGGAGEDDGHKHEKSKDASHASLLRDVYALFGNPAFADEAAPAPRAENKPKAEDKPKLPKLPAVAEGCERVTFKVEYCCPGGCPPRTEETVGELQGVAFVKADYPTMTCTVDFRAKEITIAQIKAAILDLGYPVDGTKPAKPHED
jgi:copper ion binding protein